MEKKKLNCLFFMLIIILTQTKNLFDYVSGTIFHFNIDFPYIFTYNP